MSKKIIKIMGILLCLIVSVQIMPVTIGIKTNLCTNIKASENENLNLIIKPESEIFGLHFRRAMVMGHLSKVHRIGKIVIAYVEKMHYFGIGLFKIGSGIIRDKNIILKVNLRSHLMHLGDDYFIFGHVRGLTVL